MTGKRFVNHDDTIIDNTLNEQLINTDEIVDRMNALNKECEELKLITDLFSDRELKRLTEENEQLKVENKEFKVLLDGMSNCNNEIWLDDGRIYRLRKIFRG